MQGQQTLSLSYNMHLFLPYLLNDSQTIHSTIHFSKPLFLPLQKRHLVAKNELAFSFRRIYPHSAEHSVFLTWCYPQESVTVFEGWEGGWVQVFPGLRAQQVGGQCANVANANSLGFILKMTNFNDSESTLSFERQYIRCTFRFKTLQDVFIHLELCVTHCMKDNFQKSIIGAL